jgi:hypothetical protein|tara:strand:+ start:972 stop:1172 length:201 start_codon:yes stop_codon:yes gene_type:complete
MSKIKYKKIGLKISEKVFRDVKNTLITKGMADNINGITDQVLVKIIKSMTDKEKEVEIKYKTEREE